jgi:predicted dinucleotide-binding enzyme
LWHKIKIMTQATAPTFAIVGLGNIGKVVATNLAKSKRPFIVADRNPSKGQGLADELGPAIRPMGPAAAISAADIILFAVRFDGIKELLAQYATEIKGKIVIDPSNPIAPDGKGGLIKIIGEKESGGQAILGLLPEGAILVKAYCTLMASTLAGKAFQKPDEAVLFYAADDNGVAPAIEGLIRDSGFEPLHIGGIDRSIRIEAFGDLNELGVIGRAVTLAEANSYL